jgi:hypothetical protein
MENLKSQRLTAGEMERRVSSLPGRRRAAIRLDTLDGARPF